MPKKVNVVILSESCKKCGICHGFCPQDVFTLTTDGTPVVSRPESCNYCRLCDLRCPDFAISLEVLG